MGEMGDNSGYKDFVAGMLAGVATVAVGHPFDTVKVSLSRALPVSFLVSVIRFFVFLNYCVESW